MHEQASSSTAAHTATHPFRADSPTLRRRSLAADPAAQVVLRDIGSNPVPHLDGETVAASRGAAQTERSEPRSRLSDALIGELRAADVVVIGAPMYNFGIPSTLKSWFDHVLRAGVTFRYTEAGPEGLLNGKKAIVIETRAGVYSEGPARRWTARNRICATCSASWASTTSGSSVSRSSRSAPKRPRRRCRSERGGRQSRRRAARGVMACACPLEAGLARLCAQSTVELDSTLSLE